MAGPFRSDGPRLSIEFSRISLDGRVTLVIDPQAPTIQTYWTPLAVPSLDSAIRELGIREKIAASRWSDWIGVQTRGRSEQDSGQADSATRQAVAAWMAERPVDAVIWTALPGRGPSGEEGFPSVETLVDHLVSLTGSALARAEEYIRRAPEATRTPRRNRFESEFGWTPTVES